jgi:hypothetical protein
MKDSGSLLGGNFNSAYANTRKIALTFVTWPISMLRFIVAQYLYKSVQAWAGKGFNAYAIGIQASSKIFEVNKLLTRRVWCFRTNPRLVLSHMIRLIFVIDVLLRILTLHTPLRSSPLAKKLKWPMPFAPSLTTVDSAMWRSLGMYPTMTPLCVVINWPGASFRYEHNCKKILPTSTSSRRYCF